MENISRTEILRRLIKCKEELKQLKEMVQLPQPSNTLIVFKIDGIIKTVDIMERGI